MYVMASIRGECFGAIDGKFDLSKGSEHELLEVFEDNLEQIPYLDSLQYCSRAVSRW